MNYDFSEPLKRIMSKLKKKDSETHKAIKNKIREIVNSSSIEHYKNLKKPLQHLKRVHIRSSFALSFKYDRK